MTEPAVSPRRLLHELVLADASDETFVQTLTRFVEPGESVERLITSLLANDYNLSREIRLSLQVRWYRRAIDAGQLWAFYEAGTRWASVGSHRGMRQSRLKQQSQEDSVSVEEAREWVIQAAERGHRRACLEAGRWNLDDPRAVGWLQNFYGDGVPEQPSDRHELAAAALWLARVLDREGNAEAGDWYRIAAVCPPWEDLDSLDSSSWVEAVSEYAFWVHGQGDVDLCCAWAYRLLEDAANQGPSTRSFMASEWKIYRNDWQMAAGDEAVRYRVMEHLLTDHDLPEWQRVEIVLLLTNSGLFGHSDSDGFGLDEQTIKSLTLAEVVPSAKGQLVHGRGVPITARQAWAAVDWLLVDAVPAAFRIVGLEDEATDFQYLVPAEIKELTRGEWLESIEGFGGWQSLYQPDYMNGDSGGQERVFSECSSFHKVADEWVRTLADGVGLGSHRNPFRTAGQLGGEDWLSRGLNETRWRLMRGRRAWLGMYLATASVGEAVAWMESWDEASRIVVYALQGALWRIGQDLDIDWSDGDTNLWRARQRWELLKDAYELSLATFIDQARALN